MYVDLTSCHSAWRASEKIVKGLGNLQEVKKKKIKNVRMLKENAFILFAIWPSAL